MASHGEHCSVIFLQIAEVLDAVVPLRAFELYLHPANPEFRHPDLAGCVESHSRSSLSDVTGACSKNVLTLPGIELPS